ncbi:MAG: complex I NDUFA9 subunit family protein [Alphaproteobacteria bacterium]|nr:complex I NDUFA9 subunit family protein [Alphaproteobacteria bacterium]
MQRGLVTVFGGSGFVGRYAVKQLAEAGWRVRVAVRRPDEGLFLKPMGDVGQITLTQANLRVEPSVAAAVAGADAVVNLVGILYESGAQRFAAVQARGAELVARAARAAGARRLVHVSAIGADEHSASLYARSKAMGEAAVRREFPDATILRPSVIFGAEDGFLNRFGAMARISPFLPLIGGGATRFQPVYVGDVAAAIARALADDAAAGRTYELGGPRVYSFRELMALVLRETGRRRALLPIPFAIAGMQALFLELLPVPPLTRDQVELLRHDNLPAAGAPGLADLAIAPTPLEVHAPSILARYRRAGVAANPAGN